MAYKTPGVYVEEISTLPPSVAEVATAIPAFIGYTEKPGQIADGLPVPVRISSMLEYERIFGSAQNQAGIGVTVIGPSITVTPPTSTTFKMYYSLQLFFANGGGPCYVTSVGTYSVGTVTLTALQGGLKAIEKEDEPTLLLFPDATSLSSEPDFYVIYQDALTQCNKLQDRFTIMDTYTDAAMNGSGTDPVKKLRNEMNQSTEYLKYGAAYYPFVDTTLDYKYADSAVNVTITETLDYAGQATIISDSVDASNVIMLNGALAGLQTLVDDGSDPIAALLMSQVLSNVTSIRGQFMSISDSALQMVTVARTAVNNAPDPTNADVSAVTDAANELVTWINNNLGTPITQLGTLISTLNGTDDQTAVSGAIDNVEVIAADLSTAIGIAKGALGKIDILINKLEVISDGDLVSVTLAELAVSNNILYNQVIAAIASVPIKLPPSSGVAGVYARVDANSGVWSAPANTNLNYVINPTYKVDNKQQEDMNVSVTGKSVNAIRTFTGRGILIWGARTLDGNSNEWRYVPVRRFFNFAEESIKKATEAFVFQSNDANTWVKVRGMIESFLTQQWKAGALTGAKTEQAFYVSIGLGQTMTAQDILEGRMIVEIGMAVVRPAEFIVLRFTHMMQEA
ncbi:MAG: phage tail sheath family protein [Flavobacteriales bacterium]|nr:phage tail sheath family protein [Flavobacteriales bacterium]